MKPPRLSDVWLPHSAQNALHSGLTATQSRRMCSRPTPPVFGGKRLSHAGGRAPVLPPLVHTVCSLVAHPVARAFGLGRQALYLRVRRAFLARYWSPSNSRNYRP